MKPADCPEPDLLVAFGEGVLPEGIEQRVGDHLAGCRMCAGLRRDLREPPLVEPSLEQAERVRKRVFQTAKRPMQWRAPLAAALAACLAIAIYTGYKPRPQSTAAPAVVNAPAPPPVYRLPLDPAPLRLPLASALVLRGQSGGGPSKSYLEQLGKALEPYRAARYREAAGLLQELSVQNPAAVEPPFYQGVALLLDGDAKAALAPLERARQIGGEALNDDIAWYLAVAAERNGAWDQAAAGLRRLCAAEGIYREAACKGLSPR